jgi:hypothetical protein
LVSSSSRVERKRSASPPATIATIMKVPALRKIVMISSAVDSFGASKNVIGQHGAAEHEAGVEDGAGGRRWSARPVRESSTQAAVTDRTYRNAKIERAPAGGGHHRGDERAVEQADQPGDAQRPDDRRERGEGRLT